MEDLEILEINGFEYVLLAKLEYNHKNYILCAKVIDDQDVADELEVPSRMVSDIIKVNRGCSFAQFVNGYRIEYAKQLLRDRPDTKMTAVYVESGFSNEMSFFRTFKTFTGMTPKEWMVQND